MAENDRPELVRMSCGDFGEFKEALKVLRLVDDKIIYKLNTSVPTESFSQEIDAEKKCRELYTESSVKRENAIKGCIREVSNNIRQLKTLREEDPDNIDVLKRMSSEQTKLRLMHSELSVEEILKPRAMKIFNEKCWKSFKPSQ